jgi:hypothetical protein
MKVATINVERRIKLGLIFSGCAALLSQVVGLYAQNPSSQPAYLSQPPFPAANLWMTNPLPWSPASDPVPSPIRQARDKFFDQLIGNREPLTPANVKGAGISDGVPPPNQSEIPDFPNRAVALATFTSYQPVLSESRRAIYTEATFLVNDTFRG